MVKLTMDENAQWAVVPDIRPKRGRPRDATRDAALNAGYLFYAGKPCKRGHGGKRYVSTGACVDCYQSATVDEFAAIFE